LLTPEAQSMILAGAIFSIAINPFVFKTLEPLQSWLQSHSELARRFQRSTDPLSELPFTVDQSKLSRQVVLVGYGRVGRHIGAALAERGVPYVVVEQNREAVQQLRGNGTPAVAGDASEPAVLIQAHIANASVLVIATPDTFHVRTMIEIARALNPAIDTVVRTHSEEEAALLRRENAGKVFMGEHELARGMTGYILECLERK
jgi:CPA2 family monovalent cation:H+ antiporter-2